MRAVVQFAQRPENVNVQVLSLMGCGKYGIEQERACCCQPAERFYHAKMVLRHYISFFGVYERWSFSMSLLEATLRFGVGAESWPDANSRWRASDERPRASLWHTHAWRKPPLNASADWRAGASMCGTLLSRAERDGAYDPHAQEFWVGDRGTSRFSPFTVCVRVVASAVGRFGLRPESNQQDQRGGRRAVRICARGNVAARRVFPSENF